MAYTKFDEIAEKCRMFKNGEPVRCTERQYNKDGVLDADSILIVSGVLLTVNGEEKIKKNEKMTDDDIEFQCLHTETERYFWIKGSQLKKADEEAVDIVNKYNQKCFRKEIWTNIIGGLLFIMLLLFFITISFFLLRKVFNIDCDKIFIGSIFIGIIAGFILIIMACVGSIYEYRKKWKNNG